MRLRTFDYTQFGGAPREWSLCGLKLGPVNLVVGKNATGKSRTLNVVNALGKLVSGQQKPSELSTGTYEAVFEHEGRRFCYSLEINNFKVTAESFKDGDRTLLKRWEGGVGKIWHEKENEELDFQTPETDAAVVARMDR